MPSSTSTSSRPPKPSSPLNKLIIKIGKGYGDGTNDWVKFSFKNKEEESCTTKELNDNKNGYNFYEDGTTVTIDADINSYYSHQSLAECLTGKNISPYDDIVLSCFLTGSFRPDEELWMKVELTETWTWKKLGSHLDRLALSGVEAYFGGDVWVSDEKVTCESKSCKWFKLERKK